MSHSIHVLVHHVSLLCITCRRMFPSCYILLCCLFRFVLAAMLVLCYEFYAMLCCRVTCYDLYQDKLWYIVFF